MSLILTLKITPTAKDWVGTATLEEDRAGYFTQKELAMRLQLTGDEVTSAMQDLSFDIVGGHSKGWCSYSTTVQKSNRNVCLLELKRVVKILLEFLIAADIDVYVIVYNLHDTKSLGWAMSKTNDTLAEISEWQG